MLLASLPIGVLIGAVLGLVGSGGALLSTPLLLLTGHFSFQQASTSALFVVLTSSALALLVRQREQTPPRLIIKAMLWGFVGAPLGVWAGHFIANDLAKIILVILLVSAASLTWNAEKREADNNLGEGNPWLAAALFAFVGFMTGLTGIGGGYILVPVLHLVCGLKFKQSITASLYVVVANASVSMAIKALNGINLDPEQWQATGFLVAAALVGSIVGSVLSNRLNRQVVQKAFAIMLYLLAATLVIQVILALLV
jgi:uncharacterized membrane protein YfcA